MECPFCSENNHCAVDNSGVVGKYQPCWCFAVDVPDELLQLISTQKQALCVCQKCIEQYHQDKESFVKRFLNNG